MSKRTWMIVGIVAAVAAAGVAYYYWNKKRQQSGLNIVPAPPQPHQSTDIASANK